MTLTQTTTQRSFTTTATPATTTAPLHGRCLLATFCRLGRDLNRTGSLLGLVLKYSFVIAMLQDTTNGLMLFEW